MLRVYLTIVGVLLISGCTSWNYKVGDEVKFEIRSWNHDPIIKAVEDADPETFMQLGKGYGKDRDRVFYKGNEIPGADPATFEQMQWAYSRDKNGVYLFTCRLEGANPATLRLLEGSWSKDDQYVYHGHQRVEADAASFRFIGDSWAIDNSSAYHALTWISLGCENNGHLQVEVFKDIDRETFEVVDAFKAKDKSGVYDALPSPNNRVN